MPALLIPIVEVLLPLIALLLCLMARQIAAPIINAIGKELGWFGKGISWLTNKLIDLAVELTQNLAPYFFDGVHLVVNWLHHFGQLSADTLATIEADAVSATKFMDWVVTDYIPAHAKQIVQRAGDTIVSEIHRVALSGAQLRTLEHQLDGYIHRAIAATIPGVVPKAWPRVNWTPKRWREWLGLAAGAGALALPGSLAWERELSKDLHKGLTSVEKRLRSVEKVLGATGAAAVVTYGLAKIGLGWMTRCPNLKHIGKSFCAADLGGLIGLLAGVIALEEGISLLDFAEAMVAIENVAVDAILDGVSEFRGLTV